VGRPYQHHYGRRNSDVRGAQKVRRLSAVVFSNKYTGQISVPVRFAHVSRLLTRPVCLPKPANQRECATDDIIFVRSHLARTPDVVLSLGLELGRHTGIGRSRDDAAAILSKPFRINHFASVSAPSNTLCSYRGAKVFKPPSLRPAG
jgi:hypothetical protein